MLNKFFIIVLIVFSIKCEKTEEECITFPCDIKEEWYARNRVAFEPGFRIGTWASLRKNTSNPDTIIFHSDTIWSNFNSYGGIIKGKYDFQNIDIASYVDFNGTELETPFKYRTYYNDTTGILLIKKFQNYSNYLKIK